MASSLNDEIRRSLAAVVSGQLTIRAFDEWFTSATWQAEDSEDQETLALIYGVRHHLVEHSAGLWNDADLLTYFWPFIEVPEVAFGASAPTIPRR